MVFCLSGGKCDEWLKAEARAYNSSTKEEYVATGRTASTGTGGRVACITESMNSQFLSSEGNAYVCSSLEVH
jgi:hypothetical protein